MYRWVERQFAGGAIGQRIYWYDAPLAEYPAEDNSRMSVPTETGAGFISLRERYSQRSRQGEQIPGDELWSCAVFELYNISHGKQFDAIDKAAFAGQVSKAGYVEQMSQVAFLAVHETATFYRNVWQPWTESKGVPSQEYHWYANEPDTYSEWRKQYPARSGYTYDNYGKYYDEETVPYLQKMKEYNANVNNHRQ